MEGTKSRFWLCNGVSFLCGQAMSPHLGFALTSCCISCHLTYNRHHEERQAHFAYLYSFRSKSHRSDRYVVRMPNQPVNLPNSRNRQTSYPYLGSLQKEQCTASIRPCDDLILQKAVFEFRSAPKTVLSGRKPTEQTLDSS